MGKLFGTDGIRGVVGENLTADMAFRVGQAVGTVLMEEKGSRPTVVIGKDTRISSDMLESALMAGIGLLIDLNFHLLRFDPKAIHQETLAETWARLRAVGKN